MSMPDVSKLVDELSNPIFRLRMASGIKGGGLYRGLAKSAETRANQAKLEIEDKVRTWVYEDLIKKLQSLSAYGDVGHFDHSGVMGVVEYLQNELQPEEVGDEGEPGMH